MPPLSDYFTVTAIPDAGRGVVASTRIPAGTVILDTEPPAVHVIFRVYRKEVCSNCFEYDRGRTLPVRDHETGKVFCTSACQVQWHNHQDDLAVKAWKKLHNYVQAQAKRVAEPEYALDATRPTESMVDDVWNNAGSQSRKPSSAHSHVKPTASNRHPQLPERVYPDVLNVLLSGILLHHQSSQIWNEELLDLVMDEQPYRSADELTTHCQSFLQLRDILPEVLQSSCTSEVCKTVASAGSHNAFGIRGGGEDGEEYLGWAIYPAASYFNHSCSPNVLKRRVGSRWEFWTMRDVAEGEQLKITYLGGDEKEMNVVERRDRLRAVWDFYCMCERCVREMRETR